MSLGKGSTPSAPDYGRLAEQTAGANREALMLQTSLNRPTEINPYGARQWALREGADPNNPQPGDWVVADTLSPNQQNILGSREATQIGMGQAAQAGVPRLQQMMGSGVDTSGLPTRSTVALPQDENAFSADRKRVEDATYDRLTRFYGQRFGEDESALRTRLSNQGLMEGSEAYDRALRDFGQSKDAAYGDAARQAIELGGAEQSRSMSDLIRAAQAQDSRRAGALTEDLTLRQLPLNEMNALLSGAQVQNPGAANFANAGFAAGPDYLSAGAQQYQAGLDRYNARAAGVGQGVGAASNIIGAWLSDRRLKSDIEQIGTHKKLGIPTYRYTKFGKEEIGVMADEVEKVMPEAVFDVDGYKAVNYDMIGGRQ